MTPVPAFGVPEVSTRGQVFAQVLLQLECNLVSRVNRYSVRPCTLARISPSDVLRVVIVVPVVVADADPEPSATDVVPIATASIAAEARSPLARIGRMCRVMPAAPSAADASSRFTRA